MNIFNIFWVNESNYLQANVHVLNVIVVAVVVNSLLRLQIKCLILSSQHTEILSVKVHVVLKLVRKLI